MWPLSIFFLFFFKLVIIVFICGPNKDIYISANQYKLSLHGHSTSTSLKYNNQQFCTKGEGTSQSQKMLQYEQQWWS